MTSPEAAGPEAATPAASEAGPRPSSIYRDRSFWGLTISQLLGSFNDNLFKQLVLLLCLDYAVLEAGEAAERGGAVADRYQPIAMAVFALPWILMSGLAGFVGDRTSKQKGIVACKILEIAVVVCGLFAFLSGQLWPLFVVLFLMSSQSTFFGPAKYGSLPELFRADDLPQINGVFQMTTFLAIIFGFASAGVLKDLLPGQQGLALVSVFSIVVAVLGTAAATLIRPTPIARPDLKLDWKNVGVDRENWALLTENRFLFGVLLVSSLFWFTGGVVQPAVNSFGQRDLGLSDAGTSVLQACMGIGIAFGCLLSGKFARHRVRFGLVTAGAWGMAVGLPVLTVLSYFGPDAGAAPSAGRAEVTSAEVLSSETLAAEGLSKTDMGNNTDAGNDTDARGESHSGDDTDAHGENDAAGPSDSRGENDAGVVTDTGGESGDNADRAEMSPGGAVLEVASGKAKLKPQYSVLSLLFGVSTVEWLARLILIELGLSAGLFVVPLQVVLQAAPPEGQKGRMIGTMNLVNWIGILLSAAFYGAFEILRAEVDSLVPVELRPGTVFSALALMIAVVALRYRPADFDLGDRDPVPETLLETDGTAATPGDALV